MRAADAFNFVIARQPVIRIAPQPARFPVDDFENLRDARLDGQCLIDLFLIAGANKSGVSGLDDKGEVLRAGVAEDAAGFAMQRVGGDLRPIHFRVILADNHHRIAGLQSELEQAHAKADGMLINLVPSVFLPDAITFFALRHPLAKFPDPREKVLRQGIQFRRDRLNAVGQAGGKDAAGRGAAIGDVRRCHACSPSPR